MKLIHRHGQPGSRQYAYRRGAKDCLPIAAGYFACAFAIGIAAKNAGLNAVEGFFASLLGNASAGEYACFTVIAADAPYVEMVLVTLVANARYILMSCAISQHIAPRTPWYWRLLIGFDLTDELFGVYIAQPGYLDPHYAAGAMSVSLPAWAIGTSLGIIAGTLLPARAVSALSVTLYGMFLAIVIPPCRKNPVMAVLVVLSFGLSYLLSVLPGVSALSDGIRTVILTVVIATVFALLFPVPDEKSPANETGAAGKEADGHEA